MNDSPFAPADQPLEKPPHEEQLSIGLLLLWTAMTAVLLGFHRATSQPTNGELGILPQLMAFISSPLIAVGMSAWVLMLWRWYTDGPQFPSQPGHWLLLLFGFTGVASLLVRTIIMISLTGLRGSGVYLGVNFVAVALALIMSVVAHIAIRDRWRILFLLNAVSRSLSLLLLLFMTLDFRILSWANWANQLLTWAFGLVMVGLAIADLRQHVRRDTLHWTGVIVVGGYLIYTTALPLLIWLR
jgi:hypothetical protein